MKSVLIIAPYENIYPPVNGGMQRCFNIIHQLSKHFKTTLICLQPEEAFRTAKAEYPSIQNLEILSTASAKPPKDIWSSLPRKNQSALRYRWYKKTLKGPADGVFLQYYHQLVGLLKNRAFDVVVIEQLATTNAVSVIRRYNNAATIIFDAHNVDSNLVSTHIGNVILNKENRRVYTAESKLHKQMDAIITCSKKDLADFITMNNGKLQGQVIPNGITIPRKLYDAEVRKDAPQSILFCGTLWSAPNNEGLLWFYLDVWPLIKKAFPVLHLLVAGSGQPGETLHQLVKDDSIEFSGTVADIRPWYNKAAVAIVPLLTGSGTRLKILEAMGFGVPVVSTTKGAEGINYTDKENIVIANGEQEFAKAIIEVLHNKPKREMLQQSARKLVTEQYDWNTIGDLLAQYIKTFVHPACEKN